MIRTAPPTPFTALTELVAEDSLFSANFLIGTGWLFRVAGHPPANQNTHLFRPFLAPAAAVSLRIYTVCLFLFWATEPEIISHESESGSAEVFFDVIFLCYCPERLLADVDYYMQSPRTRDGKAHAELVNIPPEVSGQMGQKSDGCPGASSSGAAEDFCPRRRRCWHNRMILRF